MSRKYIYDYYREKADIIRYGGSRKETAVRDAFLTLVKKYAEPQQLLFIAELSYRTKLGTTVIPDGTLRDRVQQDWGYWEAKDQYDDLEFEVEKKFAKGYPQDNILFEDTQHAILFQNGERYKISMDDPEALDQMLTQFVTYEIEGFREFREAIDRFKEDVPHLSESLREIIDRQFETNQTFKTTANNFLEQCKKAINKNVTMKDVREMLIQHILTQDIFNNIFNESQLHQENNIAQSLNKVLNTFYVRKERKKIDAKLSGYYRAITGRAASIHDHNEKQKFLKVIYETFYQAYNPKGADRLGIVYTPQEIVDFMIKSTDTLCYKHFDRGLSDENVHILDPATGTGTFITELIEYIPPRYLPYKYKHELHCNEVSILPYYIANLNIEYTYHQKMEEYEPFENILFVDTLDNIGFDTAYEKQSSFFNLSDENTARIERQNEQKISIIIGNPPYNASQENYNQQNANRPYTHIDERIKQTYVKQSKAQSKIDLYDMYTRFVRWASDRLDEQGIITFITNNSFLESRSFDGFRKTVAQEFTHIYIIDLGGNIRKLSGKDGIFLNEEHTIFGMAAAVGISIMFLVREKQPIDKKIAQINYIHPCDIRATRLEKLAYLNTHPIEQIPFEYVRPDKQHNWLNITDNDFESLLPLVSKDAKAGKSKEALFKLFSLGIATGRDEWVTDYSKQSIINKMKFFISIYEQTRKNEDYPDKWLIKWNYNLTRHSQSQKPLKFNNKKIIQCLYRPYVKSYLYFDRHLNARTYQNYSIFPDNTAENIIIAFSGLSASKPFQALASNKIVSLDFMEKTQCVPLYEYGETGNRVENITSWGLQQFQEKYNDTTINGEHIFHYVYAVLHHPAYRTKYEINLKRDFPRIPFYDNFWQWQKWGETLMNIHLNYEEAQPYPLQREDKDPDTIRKPYKPTLRRDKKNGNIIIDTYTTLTNIPPSAYDYKLGNRSAIEWVLDRYKERKPRDETIREKFNTYRFLDYKEEVIQLLMKVTTVSTQTIELVNQMPKESTHH